MDFQNTRRSLFFILDVNYIKYANCPAVRMDMLRLGERVVIQLQRFIKKYCETRNATQERCGFGKKCRRGMRACIGESNIGLPYVGLSYVGKSNAIK